jgi:hypothetical protein
VKFDKVRGLPEGQFRRITGVKRKTFDKMVEIVQEAHQRKKSRGGRPNKLAIEDMVLMTLEYLREYRTYLHIAASYGLSESSTFTCIRWIEDTLIKSKEFSLPGRKALLKSDHEFEVILIDATESPIERPKKNSVGFIQEKRKNIR